VLLSFQVVAWVDNPRATSNLQILLAIVSDSVTLAQCQSNGFVIDNTFFPPRSFNRTTRHSTHGRKGLRKIEAAPREPGNTQKPEKTSNRMQLRDTADNEARTCQRGF